MVPQKVQLLAGENIVQVSCLYPSLSVGLFSPITMEVTVLCFVHTLCISDGSAKPWNITCMSRKNENYTCVHYFWTDLFFLSFFSY